MDTGGSGSADALAVTPSQRYLTLVLPRAEWVDSVKNATAKTRVSTKGQVILPKAIRDKHNWKPGTELNVEETPNGVLLTRTLYFAPKNSRMSRECCDPRSASITP